MQTYMIRKIAGITLTVILLGQTSSFAKGGGGNGGVGNCNGNGNIKHGCGSSVITPDVLTQTSQGNARQPTAPIPTANQLPPQVPPPIVAPPLAPQQIPMAVPPLVPQQVPMATPPLVPQRIPQMVSINTPLNISPPQNTQPPNQPVTKPLVEVTLKASSAGYNGNMITNIPGRQPADSYAVFKNEATGGYRECVVSGLETRKVIMPSGEVVYRGTLPSFRTVSNEVADIPSWHPHEAGCIISLEHRKK